MFSNINMGSSANKLLFGLFIIIFIGCTTTEKVSAIKDNSVKKYALVIGNTNYKHIPQLQNPRNDAADVANALRQSGFTVELCYNLNYEQMEMTIDKYIDNLSGKDNAEGFFYYAGTGFSFNGGNYLVPVDFNPNNMINSLGSYAMGTLFKKLIKADNALNIVIVDTCFTEIPLTYNGLSVENDGLELIDQFTKDIFYLQAALPGKTALDGGISERNSPFTRALLKNIVKPVEFVKLVQDITTDTLMFTNRQQRPYYKANVFNYNNYKIH